VAIVALSKTAEASRILKQIDGETDSRKSPVKNEESGSGEFSSNEFDLDKDEEKAFNPKPNTNKKNKSKESKHWTSHGKRVFDHGKNMVQGMFQPILNGGRSAMKTLGKVGSQMTYHVTKLITTPFSLLSGWAEDSNESE
jgi:hypothetical protein